MKTQIFLDGNKCTSVIFANHFLISNGRGLPVIPEKEVPEFEQLLVKYYEGEDIAGAFHILFDLSAQAFIASMI